MSIPPEKQLTPRQQYDHKRYLAKLAQDPEGVRQNSRLYTAQRRTQDPEKFRTYQKEWRQSHPDNARKHHQTYTKAHPEKVQDYLRHYRHLHPEVMQVINARYYANKCDAPINDLTTKQWEEIKAAYGHRCVYCNRKMQRLTMDHIVPLSKGGSHTVSNIVPACQSCNSKKNDGPPPHPVQPLLCTIAMSKVHTKRQRR